MINDNCNYWNIIGIKKVNIELSKEFGCRNF